MNEPRPKVWTVLSLLNWTTTFFHERHIESPRPAAEILLAHTLGLNRIDLYLRHDQPLTAPELARYKGLIKRRIKGEPVAYITGVKEFWSLEFQVSPEVLIPRPETECLIEAALPILKTKGRGPRHVLELGTGSGAIIVALASEMPHNRYIATDRSLGALALARRNAQILGYATCIDFIAGDWFTPFRPGGHDFDLIVSNPPYIRSGDIQGLAPEISHFEPAEALDGNGDGLGPARRIIQEAHVYLRPGGELLLEMGCDQGAALQALATQSKGYRNSAVAKDYGGLERILHLKRL